MSPRHRRRRPTFMTQELLRGGGGGAASVAYVTNSTDFNGSDEYYVASDGGHIDFAHTDPRTYTLWVKHEGTLGTQHYLTKRNSGFRGYALYTVASGVIAYQVIGSTTGKQLAINTASGQVAVDGNWYHIAWVDGGGTAATQKCYINGAEVSLGSATSDTLTDTCSNATAFKWCSDTNGVPARLFNGNMSTGLIWDRVLTDLEIADLAARPIVDPTGLAWYVEAELVAGYKFDSAGAGTMADIGGNGYDLTEGNLDSGNLEADVPA